MDTKNPQVAGGHLRASNVAGNNSIALSTTTPADATVVDRHVVITGGAIGLYCVTVQPPLPGHDPQIFDSYKRARGAASGLRLVYRWPIVDETGEAQ